MYRRHSTASKDTPEHTNGSTDNDVIRDIFQLISSLSCYECDEDWGLVQVPEQKQFSAVCCCAAHMAKQVRIGIPEHTVETQHNLQGIT